MNKIKIKKITKGFKKNGVDYPEALVVNFSLSKMKKNKKILKMLFNR